MRDYSNKYGYAPASSSVIDGAIIEDSVRHRLMIVIDLWAWNGGVFEHLNVSPDGSVNGGRPRKFPLGDASPPLPDVTCSCSRRTTSQGTPTD
ncbi:sialidase [Cutibacterium acnes JCM 18920]|nr:sialidase [Cutibacterium acnes JCM 18920]